MSIASMEAPCNSRCWTIYKLPLLTAAIRGVQPCTLSSSQSSDHGQTVGYNVCYGICLGSTSTPGNLTLTTSASSSLILTVASMPLRLARSQSWMAWRTLARADVSAIAQTLSIDWHLTLLSAATLPRGVTEALQGIDCELAMCIERMKVQKIVAWFDDKPCSTAVNCSFACLLKGS